MDDLNDLLNMLGGGGTPDPLEPLYNDPLGVACAVNAGIVTAPLAYNTAAKMVASGLCALVVLIQTGLADADSPTVAEVIGDNDPETITVAQVAETVAATAPPVVAEMIAQVVEHALNDHTGIGSTAPDVLGGEEIDALLGEIDDLPEFDGGESDDR